MLLLILRSAIWLTLLGAVVVCLAFSFRRSKDFLFGTTPNWTWRPPSLSVGDYFPQVIAAGA